MRYFFVVSSEHLTYSRRISSPKEVHEALVDPSTGRKFASVTEINEVGHLVSVLFVYKHTAGTYSVCWNLQIPQRIPDKLGRLFYKILASITDRPAKL